MHILSGGLLGSLPKEQKRGEGEGKFYLWYCDKIVAAGQEGRGGKLKEEEGGEKSDDFAFKHRLHAERLSAIWLLTPLPLPCSPLASTLSCGGGGKEEKSLEREDGRDCSAKKKGRGGKL